MNIKSFKKIVLLIFALLIFLCCSAFAKDIDVSYVSWVDSNGEEISKPLSGEKLESSVTVKNNSEEEKQVVFLVNLKKDGVILEFKSDDAVIKNNEEKKLNVSFLLPNEDISNISFEAFLLESIESMNPLCNLGTFPTDDKTVLSTKVNGKEITFNEEKNCDKVLISNNKSYPEVYFEPLDNSVKVEEIKPDKFPGKSIVSVISPDKTKDIYNIPYKTDLHINFKYVGPKTNNGEPYTDNSEFHENSFAIATTHIEDRDGKPTIVDNRDGSPIYVGYKTGCRFTKINLPEKYNVLDSSYVSLSWNYCAASDEATEVRDYYKSSKNKDLSMFELEIPYDADIVVFSQYELPEGFDNNNGYVTLPHNEGGEKFAQLTNAYALEWIKLENVSVKELRLPDGKEKEMVPLYAGNTSYSPYVVFIIGRYNVGGAD